MVDLGSITLCFIDKGFTSDDQFTLFAKNQILHKYKEPISKDDTITVRMLGHKISLKVIDANPPSGFFSENTKVDFDEETIIAQPKDKNKLSYPSEFVAKIISGGRITIPEEIRELNELNEGDILHIGFQIMRARARIPPLEPQK